MDHSTSKERELFVDLENGGTGCKDDTNNDPILGDRRVRKMLNRLSGGVSAFDGSGKVECSLNSYSNWGKSSEVPLENIELLIENNSAGPSGEHVSLLEKKNMKEKRKKTNSKKAPKPPRPPKGPALDTTDLKLVKEISELAMKKRARIERMKVLKKTKAMKSSSSSNSSLSAMIVTLLFCLVIIFRGICSRNNMSASFQGSPEPAAAANGLISVQLYDNFLASDSTGRSSESPRSVEDVSGSEFTSPG